MAYSEADLPFKRGETYYGTGTTATETDDSALEGREYAVSDITYNTGRPVVLKIVRNASGITLTPKRVIRYSAGYQGRRTDGYTVATAAWGAGVVDDYYAVTGSTIRDGDLFYAVVSGPVVVQNDIAASAANLLPVGTDLVALTAATTGATTAGRVSAIDLTGATAPLGNQILNSFGKALTATTTGNTATDLLALVNFRL